MAKKRKRPKGSKYTKEYTRQRERIRKIYKRKGKTFDLATVKELKAIGFTDKDFRKAVRQMAKYSGRSVTSKYSLEDFAKDIYKSVPIDMVDLDNDGIYVEYGDEDYDYDDYMNNQHDAAQNAIDRLYEGIISRTNSPVLFSAVKDVVDTCVNSFGGNIIPVGMAIESLDPDSYGRLVEETDLTYEEIAKKFEDDLLSMLAENMPEDYFTDINDMNNSDENFEALFRDSVSLYEDYRTTK